jgi:hypothetical protein
MINNVRAPYLNADQMTLNQAASLLGWKVLKLRGAISAGKLATETLPGGSKRMIVGRKALERFARRMGTEIQERQS